MGEPIQQWRITFDKAELILMGMSHKYSPDQTNTLFSTAKLRVLTTWADEKGIYTVTLLQKP